MYTRNLLAIHQSLIRASSQWLLQGITQSVKLNCGSDLVGKHPLSNTFSTASRLLRDDKPPKPVIKNGPTTPDQKRGYVLNDDIAQKAKNMDKETNKLQAKDANEKIDQNESGRIKKTRATPGHNTTQDAVNKMRENVTEMNKKPSNELPKGDQDKKGAGIFNKSGPEDKGKKTYETQEKANKKDKKK